MHKELFVQYVAIIKQSKMFDEDYYYENYPDVKESGMDAVVHYLAYGGSEDRNPNWWFNTKLYKQVYPDIVEANVNPFLHYILHGKDEYRKLFFENEEDALKYIDNADEDLQRLHRWATFYDNFPLSYEKYKSKFYELIIKIATQLLHDVNMHKVRSSDVRRSKQVYFSECIQRILPSSMVEKKAKKLLAFYINNLTEIKFYSPIMKHIPTDFVDIVCATEYKQEVYHNELILNGLEEHNLVSGVEQLENYDTIFCDFGRVTLDTDLNFLEFLDKNKETKLVLFSHSLDFIPTEMISYPHTAFIMAYSAIVELCNEKTFFRQTEFSRQRLEKIASHTKIEYAYTGPFHMGEYLKRLDTPREIFKKELEEILEVEFDTNKKVICYLEDQEMEFGQMVTFLNRLAEHTHMIFKPLVMPQDYLSQLSEKVIVWKDKNYAPNQLRFGVDAMLVGFNTGSLVSGCMLGIPIMPVFSSLYRKNQEGSDYLFIKTLLKNQLHAAHLIFLQLMWASNSVNAYEEKSSNYIVHPTYLRFAANNYLFDISDIDRLLAAINGDEYFNWYNANIKEIQKEVFGDYFLENAAEKTAEYILDYAKNGTFGTNCASVYLKPEYLNG